MAPDTRSAWFTLWMANATDAELAESIAEIGAIDTGRTVIPPKPITDHSGPAVTLGDTLTDEVSSYLKRIGALR